MKILISLTLLLSTSSFAAPLVYKNYVCESQIKEIFERWSLSEKADWRKQPSEESDHSFKAHGAELGEWITISSLSKTETKLEHFLPDGKREEAILNKTQCAKQRWTIQSLPEDDSKEKTVITEFTDGDLKKILGEKNSGILYVWSPNMSLSKEGVHDILTSAKKLGLGVTYIMDPVADEGFAKTFIEEQKLPQDAIKRVASRELAGHSVTLHYPSVVVYRDGKICDTVQRGYRDAETYQKIVEGIFGDCK